MARRRRSASVNPFHYHPEMIVDGHTVERGDTIKIYGEHGTKFRFNALVTNPETGVQWVDCFELDKGVTRSWRAFYPERVKRIPKRRKRVVGDSIS